MSKSPAHFGGAVELPRYPVLTSLFFDHPSGRSRILMAMKWKAERAEEAAANARRAAADDARRGWSPASAAEWSRQHEPK